MANVILSVLAHPDDAEFGAGPTIAYLARAGVRVDYVVTTDGSKGTEDPDVTPDLERLAQRADYLSRLDFLILDHCLPRSPVNTAGDMFLCMPATAL